MKETQNWPRTQRIQTATPALIRPTELWHFTSFRYICQAGHSIAAHIKGMQVTCYWKYDAHLGKSHVRSKQRSEKLERKKSSGEYINI